MPASTSLDNKSSLSSFRRGDSSFKASDGGSFIEGKPLPRNLDAEQGLLAACILDTTGEVIGRCMEQSIGADHFFQHNHQVIYEALLDLHNENIEVDEIVLSEKLSSSGNLETVGGQDALLELTSRIYGVRRATQAITAHCKQKVNITTNNISYKVREKVSLTIQHL